MFLHLIVLVFISGYGRESVGGDHGISTRHLRRREVTFLQGREQDPLKDTGVYVSCIWSRRVSEDIRSERRSGRLEQRKDTCTWVSHKILTRSSVCGRSLELAVIQVVEVTVWLVVRQGCRRVRQGFGVLARQGFGVLARQGCRGVRQGFGALVVRQVCRSVRQGFGRVGKTTSGSFTLELQEPVKVLQSSVILRRKSPGISKCLIVVEFGPAYEFGAVFRK